jgi:hypothetical protein
MIDTNGHTTVVVETQLPAISAERKSLIERIVSEPPQMWWTPESKGIDMKTIMVAGVLALGIILIVRGR